MQTNDPPIYIVQSNMPQFRDMCINDPMRATANMMAGVPRTEEPKMVGTDVNEGSGPCCCGMPDCQCGK